MNHKKRANLFLITTLAFLGRFVNFFVPAETGRNTLRKVNKIYHFTLTVPPHYL